MFVLAFVQQGSQGFFGSQPVAVSKMQPGSGGLMPVPGKPINQAGYKLLMLL